MSLLTVPMAAPGATTLTNSAFWPEFQTQYLRAALRLDGTVTDVRLIDAAVQAMVSVNRDLRDWRSARQLDGYQSLEAVPAETVNGEHELVVLYRRAVLARTKASLIERYRDIDTTPAGDQKADRLEPAITDCYRDARFAIRDILGVGHTTVALI